MNTRQALSSRPFADTFNFAGAAMNGQHDRAAANAAIFHQGLLPLRRVDLKQKRLTAMRTDDFRFVNQFHGVVSDSILAQQPPLTSAPKSPLVTPFLIDRNKARRR
jgi:hypothetical protein